MIIVDLNDLVDTEAGRVEAEFAVLNGEIFDLLAGAVVLDMPELRFGIAADLRMGDLDVDRGFFAGLILRAAVLDRSRP